MRFKRRGGSRKRRFQELERKAIIGVIAAAVLIVLVTTIAAYFGLNVHEH